ncbi:MAG: hypothetical protein K9N46_11435 [Candidatus Marinimicrobia bacterium]|nr:hypothetical protein [Candidatus Neomarinimicrobiota bacterium]MCF7827427.1 hypothetical protein [Candidatus Neomarinimicrobiota bacterium]MCF7881340.1 hypothetical protein [Candidatus Neomarinimicrobiota bacterium]
MGNGKPPNSGKGGIPPILLLAVFIVLILVPLVLILVMDHRDAIQEFVLVFLMAVGCSGLFVQFSAEFNVTIGKYKATGATAILLLILFFHQMVTTNVQQQQEERPDQAQNITEIEQSEPSPEPTEQIAPSQQKASQSMEAREDVESHATASQDVTREQQPAAQEESGKPIESVRIVYPVGVEEFKAVAFTLDKAIRGRFSDASVGVYSIGNAFKAIFNSEGKYRQEFHVYVQPDIRQSGHLNLRNSLSRIDEFVFIEDPEVKNLGKEDVVIRIGS